MKKQRNKAEIINLLETSAIRFKQMYDVDQITIKEHDLYCAGINLLHLAINQLKSHGQGRVK